MEQEQQEQQRTEPEATPRDETAPTGGEVEAALAHGVNERMSTIELAIDTAERVIAPKLACLAARRQLLDILTDQQEAEHPSEQATEPAAGKQQSLIGGMWAAIRGVAGGDGKSEAARPEEVAVVRFSRKLVETMLPEQLLLDLVAPFERFIADARAALLLWKAATQTASKQEDDATTTTNEMEVQMFGQLLIRLLDESMAPIVAYLTYLQTERIDQRIITPLCQGADLEADEPYWTILAHHFKQPALLARLDSLPPDIESFGSVRPARQRTGAEAVAVAPLALIAGVGWGSVIVRLSVAIDTLESLTLARHPDRGNIESLAALAKLFFARLERTSAGLVGLRYD